MLPFIKRVSEPAPRFSPAKDPVSIVELRIEPFGFVLRVDIELATPLSPLLDICDAYPPKL
jgi:hypothetical protein